MRVEAFRVPTGDGRRTSGGSQRQPRGVLFIFDAKTLSLKTDNAVACAGLLLQFCTLILS